MKKNIFNISTLLESSFGKTTGLDSAWRGLVCLLPSLWEPLCPRARHFRWVSSSCIGHFRQGVQHKFVHSQVLPELLGTEQNSYRLPGSALSQPTPPCPVPEWAQGANNKEIQCSEESLKWIWKISLADGMKTSVWREYYTFLSADWLFQEKIIKQKKETGLYSLSS